MVGDTAGEGDTPLWLVRHQPFGNLRLIRRFSYSNAAKQQHRPARLNTGPRPRLSFRGFAWGTAGGEWWRGHSTLLRGRSRAGKPELRLVVARSMWEVAGTQHYVAGQNSGWKARATVGCGTEWVGGGGDTALCCGAELGLESPSYDVVAWRLLRVVAGAG